MIGRVLLVAWLLVLTFQQANAADSLVPSEARRSAEQTLLTYPEWFLVHSPAEYARTLRASPPHAFPFLAHTGQLWSAYGTVTHEQLRSDYPANLGYHTMILVLATSTTVEYSLRSAYENTLGRTSWALAGNALTAEDRFAATAAQEYVDFIRQEPWYLFDFSARLKALWTEVPLWGPSLIRKWERRYALTSEYVIKALYAKAIEAATRATYDVALMNTDVVIDAPPQPLHLPSKVDLLQTYADGTQLLSLPRYYDFRLAAAALAQQGAHITDIAGNQGDILVTIWVDSSQPLPQGRVLFTQDIQTPDHTKRVGMLMQVTELSAFLVNAGPGHYQVEHVHDY